MKLTPEMLKKIVKEEYARVMAEKAGELESVESKKNDAEEVEADEYADTLEKHVDFYKANKVKEAKLVKQLRTIREQNARIKAKIASRL